MIQGHGDANARIMLVGDSASQEDCASNKAISGYAESTLKGFAKDNDLDFTHFWRTLLIKEKGSQTEPLTNCALLSDNYKEILNNEINTIKPNIIVPLSELSLRHLTGIQGIRKYRGSVLPIRPAISPDNIRILPILGPAPYLNEDYKLRFITRLDFGKLKRREFEQGPIPKEGNLWIADKGEQVRRFFERNQGAKFVVFDIETFVSMPTCLSFCFDGVESCTVPLLDWNISHTERCIMAGHVAKLLASDIPKVNQNILTFDWSKMERYGFKVENVIGDTMVLANLLYAEFPRNLGFLTSIYTELPYHKDEGKEGAYDPGHSKRETFYLYCAKDSLATYQIYEKQVAEIDEAGVTGVHEMLKGVFTIYKRMMDRGIRIDETQRAKLIIKYEVLKDIQNFKLQRMAGKEVNPNSPKQMAELVYQELKFKPISGVKRKKKGGYGTDEESLELLAWMGIAESTKYANEILKCIVNCRKIDKVLQILKAPIHPDSKMRCVFNLAGTETGRTTGSGTTDNFFYFDKKGKLAVTDLGHSFQTIGKHGFELDGEELGVDLRSMFVPSPGYSFVECDLSQAEARVDAVLAEDYDILPIFDGPVGIHRLTGSWLFGCDPLDIKKGTRQYHEAKTARHAGERNMTAQRLLMMIHQTIRTCESILKQFHAKQPNIRRIFHAEIRRIVKEDRRLVAPNGRQRCFYGRFDESQVNEGISQLPQAIVTDQLKGSLRRTFDQHPSSEPLVEAHDGFLAEVRIGDEHNYARSFKDNVQSPIDFRTGSLKRDYQLIIPAEASIGVENWMAMEDLKV